MKIFSRRRPYPVGTALTGALTAGALALGALATANHLLARRAERRHPPKGKFLTVDGTVLHYTDRGEGSPIVLIHGNMVMGDDYDLSGVAAILQAHHRVIIFDRPGFGYSKRPHGQIWTAAKQADLIHTALLRLGIERPVVAGHSWGAIVALAMALRHPEDVAGLVALSGYYFWTLRPDVIPAGISALPVIGDILRYTVSPLLTWLLMPLTKRTLFSPGDVPDRFEAGYSTAMAVRPSQIRAVSQDGALMIPSVVSMRNRYQELAMPVVIIAGDGDKVVFKRRAEQLSSAIPGSVLHIVEGAGHMVHYQAVDRVAEAIAGVVALTNRVDHSEMSPRVVSVREPETV
jgi:pimeloyl-ACP methyl ester carboxylesterase